MDESRPARQHLAEFCVTRIMLSDCGEALKENWKAGSRVLNKIGAKSEQLSLVTCDGAKGDFEDILKLLQNCYNVPYDKAGETRCIHRK